MSPRVLLLLVVVSTGIAAGSTNLLKNGAFEKPLGAEWLIKSAPGVTIIRDVEERFQGKYSLKVETRSSDNTDYYGCNQRLPAPATGTKISVQTMIRTNNLTGHAGVDIHFLDSYGRRLPIYDAKIQIPPKASTSNWAKYSLKFFVPEGTKDIIAALFIKGQGSVWFDELQLWETTEDVFPKASSGAYVLRAKDPVVWFEFAEQKIFRETAVPMANLKSTIGIFGAQGEIEPFQIVITPKANLKNCSIEFTNLVQEDRISIIEKTCFSYYPIGYVDLKRLSVTTGMTGKHPDYLARQEYFDLQGNANNPVWIELDIPRTAKPGIYEGLILLKVGNATSARIPFQLSVWNFSLPEKNHLYVRSNFWLSLIRKYDRRGNAEILADYYQNLQEHRVNAFSTIDIETEIVGDSVVCSFDEFGRKIRTLFENYGFEAITVGPFLGDAAGWKYRRNWMKLDPGSVRFERLFQQYCNKLERYLIANGWIDYCWIGYWDEPQLDDPDFDRIVRIGKIIKKTAPNLRVFMTKWPTPELFGIVDIWCLPFTEKAFNKQAILERKSHGEKIFVYNNDPYIDTPLIDKRLYTWRYRLAAIDGVYAWWNLTFWQKNPYDFPLQVESKGARDDTLKPGDGVLLYPDPAGAGPPVNSLRWEAFRQGLEDYEYLYLLEKTIANAMQKLDVTAEFSNYANYRINKYLNTVLGNYFNTWTKDVEHLYNVRARIAEEIMITEQSPVALIKTQPQEGPLEPGKVIEVTGLVEPGTEVLINDNPVAVSSRGIFVFHIKNPANNEVVIKLIRGTKEKILKRLFA
jgi:hypothetical protein